MIKKLYFHYQGQEQLSKVFKVPNDDDSTTFLVLLNKFVVAYNSKFGDNLLRSAELQLVSTGRDVLPTTRICDTDARDVHVTRVNRCEQRAFSILARIHPLCVHTDH